MTATRQQDEVLLEALALLRGGLPITAVARALEKDTSNLRKALRAVVCDDAEHDGDVLRHYPRNLTRAVK